MTVLLALALFLASPGPVASATPTADAPHGAPAEMQFDNYVVVFLRRGPKSIPGATPEAEALQKNHLNHLFGLLASGKMVSAGPFDEQDDPNLRGVEIYAAGVTKEEARKLAEEDPAVKSGHLKVELAVWYLPKGQISFKQP
jgi:uncharacterized protein YciI